MWLIPILVVLVAVILIRTLLFVPKKQDETSPEAINVDADKATRDLAEMIKCQTISHRNPDEDDEDEFLKFEQLLPKLFPKVYATCSFEKVGNRGLLLRWKGKNPDSPSVFMSHYDVVSVEAADWQKPAFEGILED